MAKAKNKTIADLDNEIKDNGKLTDDGTEKKQGEQVVKEAFGVQVVTNY
nr:MAG TPA: hypothetical protein [Caudoviricetes sp.]